MATIQQMVSDLKRQEFVKSILADEFNLTETMKVLTHNFPIFASWGVSKRVNYYNKALMLHVNGRYHKGKVWITLAWDDTYTVYIATNQNRVIKKFEMVYFDMLTDVIDTFIETRK